jgi:hypothetical protein
VLLPLLSLLATQQFEELKRDPEAALETCQNGKHLMSRTPSQWSPAERKKFCHTSCATKCWIALPMPM